MQFDHKNFCIFKNDSEIPYSKVEVDILKSDYIKTLFVENFVIVAGNNSFNIECSFCGKDEFY